MKVTTLFTLAVVLGYHMADACPPAAQLDKEVQRCLKEMMEYVDAEGDSRAKCSNLKEGLNCIDNIVEACKDSDAFQTQYSSLKNRLSKSREDFNVACYHMADSCPSDAQMDKEVQRCLKEVMLFVEAEGDNRAMCSNLEEGLNCIDNIVEACKDSEAFQSQYSYMKDRLSKSRGDFNVACGSGGVGVRLRSSVLLILSTYLLSLWLRK